MADKEKKYPLLLWYARILNGTVIWRYILPLTSDGKTISAAQVIEYYEKDGTYLKETIGFLDKKSFASFLIDVCRNQKNIPKLCIHKKWDVSHTRYADAHVFQRYINALGALERIDSHASHSVTSEPVKQFKTGARKKHLTMMTFCTFENLPPPGVRMIHDDASDMVKTVPNCSYGGCFNVVSMPQYANLIFISPSHALALEAYHPAFYPRRRHRIRPSFEMLVQQIMLSGKTRN